jgi:hypothetical protein
MDVSRRTLVSAIAAGAVGTAGCLDGMPRDAPAVQSSADGSPSPTDRPLPDECPTSQCIDVEWPAELTDETVAHFARRYENAYYREVVVEYEPGTMIDKYGLTAYVNDPVAVDGGYEVVLSGSGGVYQPPLHLAARTADPPSDADLIPVEEVSDDGLWDLIETAAAEGEAETTIESDRERVDHVIERVASLSADVHGPHSPGAEDTGYFDVDGTTVELTLQAGNLHGDYWWSARYYVDEHVVRRVDEEDGEPREDGTLLECREQS